MQWQSFWAGPVLNCLWILQYCECYALFLGIVELDVHSTTCGAVGLQGHALYYGRAQLADEYFQRLGYQLPYRVNVADFILDLASADVSADGRCGSLSHPHSPECGSGHLLGWHALICEEWCPPARIAPADGAFIL